MQLSLLPSPDTYWSIAAPVEAEYKEKNSKFLAYAFPIGSEQDIKNQLDALRKAHFKATHHCYAYRLGADGGLYRANDDGEPSGTAGRPILGQIDSFGVTNVLVVVVRYYGGIKLGVSGLKDAYKASAAAAFAAAQKVEKIVEITALLRFQYAQMSDVMNYLKEIGVVVIASNYGESAELQIQFRQSLRTSIEARCAELEVEFVPQETGR